jgi:hypothetical protein
MHLAVTNFDGKAFAWEYRDLFRCIYQGSLDLCLLSFRPDVDVSVLILAILILYYKPIWVLLVAYRDFSLFGIEKSRMGSIFPGQIIHNRVYLVRKDLDRLVGWWCSDRCMWWLHSDVM